MSTDSTGPSVRGLASRLVRPRRTAYRVVMRQGNSLVVSLPLEFLHALGLMKGDHVELVLDESPTRLYMKRAKPLSRRREPEPAPQLPLEVSR